MIAFTFSEILSSVIYAVIYGALFSAFASAVRLLKSFLCGLFAIPGEVVRYERIFRPPSFKEHLSERGTGRTFRFLSVIAFTLGYLLISYLSLDGVIRLYMLIIAFASLYVSNFVFSEFLSRIFKLVFDFVLKALCLFLRLLLLPFLGFFARKAK